MKDMTYVLDRLLEFTELENDEFSNACDALIDMYAHITLMSKTFRNALDTELRENLRWYEENTTISYETITPASYEVAVLLANSDFYDEVEEDIDPIETIIQITAPEPYEVAALVANGELFDEVDNTDNIIYHFDKSSTDKTIDEIRKIMQEMNESPELHMLASEDQWVSLVESMEDRPIEAPIHVEKFFKNLKNWSDEEDTHPDHHKTTAECITDFLSGFAKRKKDDK